MLNVNPTFLKLKYHQWEKQADVFQLDGNQLPKEDVHVFISGPCIARLALAQLQHSVFHQSNDKMKDKFQARLIKIRGLELEWYRFPKEYLEVYKRIAANAWGTSTPMCSRMLLPSTIKFLRNVLEFSGPTFDLCYFARDYISSKKFDTLLDNVASITDGFSQLELD